jgi:hypothetical protein
VSDLIAAIHLIRFPVKEPERMRSALGHLEQTLALSEESWRFIRAETDDDREWLPNPRQTGVLRVAVSDEMIDRWLEAVAEARKILAGERLLPFWRDGETRGVNLRRVFTEPTTFDLVLWFQGTAATPYLESGTITDSATWTRIVEAFGGSFPGFAAWFN